MSSPIRLGHPELLPSGAFEFTFANTPGGHFTAHASQSISTPFAGWTVLPGLQEASPGQYRFSDPAASTLPRRYYRITSP